ncbi:MAG: BrnA antitoxin family protein [Clostridia bacterium]|nr:BrnA antitoxin family protein [Clostridia bacterium]MBQ9461307.1 BrnA antitoxin family protein [Clostridia bacterium]
MRQEYDFSKGIKNPYLKRQKQQVTINLDIEAVEYFKAEAQTSGIPYQTLINLYLKDCMENNRHLQANWG